jgi:predicted alpha/beta hydrolase
LDIDAVLAHAEKELGAGRLYLLGHSAGGQLAGLAPASERLDGFVHVAVSSAWPGHWPWRQRVGMELLMRMVIPALSLGDNFPARRFGISSVNVPSGVISQWARWARTPGYLFDPAHGYDLRRFRQLRMPLLSLRFTDDSYATERAAEAILAQYSSARIMRRVVSPAEHGGKPIGHFGYFRDRFRDTLWRETAEWLASDIPARVARHG